MADLLMVSLCLIIIPFDVIGFGNDIVIKDATDGQTVIIHTLPLIEGEISLTLASGTTAVLEALLRQNGYNISSVQNNHLAIKYNATSQEAFLTFDVVKRKDEGLYRLEWYYFSPSEVDLKSNDGYLTFQLNVYDQCEVKSVHIGDNITMEFIRTSEVSRLYHNGEMVARIFRSNCNIRPYFIYYRRLRCVSDELSKRHIVAIDNVAQNDIGVYTIRSSDTTRNERWFLNVTAKEPFATEASTSVQGASGECNKESLSRESIPNPTKTSLSENQTSSSLCVPIFAIPVVLVAVIFIPLIISGLCVYCRNKYSLVSADGRISLAGCDSNLYNSLLPPGGVVSVPHRMGGNAMNLIHEHTNAPNSQNMQCELIRTDTHGSEEYDVICI